MKVEQKHLDAAKKEFEIVRKFKFNMLDYSSKYFTNSIENLILRYTCNIFNSYDINSDSEYSWDDFYTLLEHNIGSTYEELFLALKTKYSLFYAF